MVYYRMAGIKSPLSNSPPIIKSNLLRLQRVCLKSFVESFRNSDIRMVFILDHCDESYVRMIEEEVPFEYEICNTAIGINNTCLLQYKLFEERGEEKALFQEGDYLWLPNTGKEIMQAVDEFDFVTPYDHPDKYETEINPAVKILNQRHWKQTISTTATFATTLGKFTVYRDIFYKHGYGFIDHERWVEIQKEGGLLYSPIPAIATHMAEDWLSPHVDWQSIWQKYL
jgi:hypothetical protein